MSEQAKEMATVERLGRLGFKKAHGIVQRLAEKKRKLAIAYEHFRFVKQEKVDDFNKKLRVKTEIRTGVMGSSYQQLSFTPVENYEKVPPTEVLDALEQAQDLRCFDSFEVAHIVEVKEDPILFGRINGCSDRFFISQWDQDVRIEDLLGKNEG